MRKTLQIGYIATAAILVIAAMMSGCYSQPKEQKIPVRVLILPKFELDKITGDFPGETQFFMKNILPAEQLCYRQNNN